MSEAEPPRGSDDAGPPAVAAESPPTADGGASPAPPPTPSLWRRLVPPFGRRGGLALALACLATFFVYLDSQALVLALSAIGRDFHASVPTLSDMGIFLQVGAIAGLVLGMLSDRLGRRRILIAAVAGFSIANVASALAPNLVALTILRMLASCLETGAACTATALVIEAVPANARALGVSLLTIAAGAGSGLTTIVWPLVAPDWHVLYLMGSTGLLGAAVLFWLLRESEAWQATRHEEIAIKVLFERRWRGRLGAMVLATAIGSLLYVPAGLFVVLFGGELGMPPATLSAVIIVSGIVSIPAFAVGARLSDRWGRRLLGTVLAVLTAAFTGLTFVGGQPAYWTGNLIWSTLASGNSPVLGTWFGELFPTRARATSEAMNATATAVGGIAGLQVLGRLEPVTGAGGALLICAGFAVLGALLLLLLPETSRRPLPE
ncbi:MAG: MFS transporter [Candidatus Dormiibacterota bacterium]